MANDGKPYVIVVGIDYSETSDLAFDKAGDRAGANTNMPLIGRG